jgi:cytoskeletal protein CcmA (bactofilin family)
MAFPKISDTGINTVIGSGSKFVGDMNLQGFVRVDGDINGNLETAGRVFIGGAARIRGNVTAKSAMIGGIVLGNVSAPEGVRLFSSAAVVGDVTTKHLVVDDGGILHGHCIALKDSNVYDSTLRDWQETQAIRSRVQSATNTQGLYANGT